MINKEDLMKRIAFKKCLLCNYDLVRGNCTCPNCGFNEGCSFN